MMFSLRQLQYQRIAERHGIEMAEQHADKWRAEAREDLGKSDLVIIVVNVETAEQYSTLFDLSN